MEFPADGKYQFLSFFFLHFHFSWQEVKPSHPFTKWKVFSPLKAELISEGLKCFALVFLIAVERSDVFPQEGFSLSFFPDGVGWNFPPNSTGKKIYFGKKQDWPQEQHLAEVDDLHPWGHLGEGAVPRRSLSSMGTPQPKGSRGGHPLLSKHPCRVHIMMCCLEGF